MRSMISELQSFANAIYGGASAFLTPYTYIVDMGVIAAGAAAFQQLQIQANADFILTHISAQNLDAAGALRDLMPVRALITDNSSGEQFSNAPIVGGKYLNTTNWNTSIGFTGGVQANYLPYPQFIQGRTALTIQITSTSGANQALKIAFNGVLSRKLSRRV